MIIGLLFYDKNNLSLTDSPVMGSIASCRKGNHRLHGYALGNVPDFLNTAYCHSEY